MTACGGALWVRLNWDQQLVPTIRPLQNLRGKEPMIRSYFTMKVDAASLGIFAKSNRLFTFVKAGTVVESENASSDLSDTGQRANRGLLQTKVFGPTVGARIEKAREFTRRGNRSNVASLGAVAKSAGVSEVPRLRRTAVL